MNERIEKEKSKYNKIYTDLVFASDDLKQMLDEKELSKRSFLNKVDTLKDYMNFLDNIEKEENDNKGFFKKILKKQQDPENKIDIYLTKNRILDIDKLNKCRSCKCKNCVSHCSMNHCYNCRDKEYVSECNKKNTLLTNSSDTVTLYQNGEEYIFNVRAYLVERDEEGNFSRYVYLIDSKDYDNQHILKYSKFKGEENYESVIEDDTQDELVRINDKFIEMGLRV
ncbi:hypothetical protein CHL78_013065 [Romboutsia weinsteinii]|uniref:DUF1292 domain-containing protein n=1 Tax=Romboutsia weinsteinii TaxID=2020949 RepID=A0A371J1B9_9FIRM|nr:hypothetical protein [Romboutsia weinsteinii]RDY26494.1 hypothetical protein CHL78_013065 [Romboutsia weinsteinii]